ncbi:hypothetical protein VTL71DRAFT_8245 [Oculimacula yallundae]|uniref:Uncharacterized protein n=1 Tax=Oculimacula yallundae TaxID=86028 RepID=A0ABR4CX94_9HELO
MTSISPTARPVLGDLNANTPLGRSGAQGLETSKSTIPTKPSTMVESLSHESFTEGRSLHSVIDTLQVLGAKRKADLGLGEVRSEAKRLKETGDMDEARQQVQQIGVGVLEVHRRSPQRSNRGGVLELDENAATEPTSPASSYTSQDDSGLNDSQLTNITIPEDNLPAPRPFLTREQLRQKAREVKLRLSLASYKVRTNQIDIPISRLEVRSSTTSSRIPPLPRSTTQSSQTQQTVRPSSAPHPPNNRLQGTSAEIMRPQQPTISSSPPARRSTRDLDLASPKKVNDATRGAFATPLLPRQRHGVLNPPSLSGSPSWEDRGNDLTSSVVKDRAADGLLSLMRQS